MTSLWVPRVILALAPLALLSLVPDRVDGFLVPWSLGPLNLGRSIVARIRGRAAADSTTPIYNTPPTPPTPLEASLTATQLIERWGYPAESHSIQTEDGYLLTLQRVPWGRESPPLPGSDAQPRPVVFMQHGLLQSADQWLLRGPGKDLAFILADLGYDVWLGNFRGNTYSRRHVALSPEDDQFWDFSWHENGFYDLASSIDYALSVSGQPSLFYIGHSMGTTSLLVLLSTRPEYNSRIRASFLMAPVVYFTQPRGVLAVALPLFRELERDLRTVRHELLPRSGLQRAITTSLCREGSAAHQLCSTLYFQAAGIDAKEFNSTLFTVIVAHIPAGASIGQFTHYAQVYKSGQFRQFDHGTRDNVGRYGTTYPPQYNLQNVVSPVLLHYSSGDYLSSAQDVERVALEIPGLAGLYKVPWKDFNHGDYMWANDSYELLYKTVVKLMRQF